VLVLLVLMLAVLAVLLALGVLRKAAFARGLVGRG